MSKQSKMVQEAKTAVAYSSEGKEPALPLVVDGLAFWKRVAEQLLSWQREAGLLSTRLTIVVPFVQLIAPLRMAWTQIAGNTLLPRIETTQTWASRIGGMHESGSGPTFDAILDALQAKEWLQRFEQEHSLELAHALVEPLVEMTQELVRAAGQVSAKKRAEYWEQAQELAQEIPPGVAGVEAALGPIAVAWAQATERWASDVLFQQAALSHQTNNAHAGERAQGLVVIQAGGEEHLEKNLFEAWEASHRYWLNLDELGAPKKESLRVDDGFLQQDGDSQSDPLSKLMAQHSPSWQRAKDGEDEAEQAAAKVIHLLQQGIAPVALCSQDRPIARRIWALLNRYNLGQEEKIQLSDETGWTLSTTRSAAIAFNLAKAALPHALTDDVLEALKALPETLPLLQHLDLLEEKLRAANLPFWPEVAPDRWPEGVKVQLQKINDLLQLIRPIQNQETLWNYLRAFEAGLKKSTVWSVLLEDDAGREVLQTLYLNQADFSDERFSPFSAVAQSTQMSYFEFIDWIRHALESVTFIPPAPPRPQVVLTPLARVMLRPFAAVVIPGCDESRLTALPSFPGFWRQSDRLALGLMHRERWWSRLQAQWVLALRLPHVTLLWRTLEGSQPLSPASLVQRVVKDALLKTEGESQEEDGRQQVQQQPKPQFAPSPAPGARFSMNELSASAYSALRNCPYQFYARYQLKLRALNELDVELSRKDYGNWLHAVLRAFHLKRRGRAVVAGQEDQLLLEQCAQTYAQELDAASLIPWQARWPALRDAYLKWLHRYEQEGGTFSDAEFRLKHALSEFLTLTGRVDRLDYADGKPILIDYKTERRSITERRARDEYEDVQLPFYALLAQGYIDAGGEAVLPIKGSDEAKAVYLSLDDREESAKAVEMKALHEVKVLLAASILSDFERIQQGSPLYPIGQAHICDYCDAKGLCRKPYWTEPLLDAEKGEV